MSKDSWSDPPQVVKALSEALKQYDWGQARVICSRLVGDIDTATEPYPEKPSKVILNLLRRKRRFDLMEIVADAMIRAGQLSGQIRRQYAQCLIDQGRLSAAGTVLDAIIGDPDVPEAELAEALGLKGRIYKQLYVNSHDPSNPRQQMNLKRAVQRYFEVYRTDPKLYLWHGINSVALIERAARDKIELQGIPSSQMIAAEINGILQQMDEIAYFDRATAIENAVAHGDWKDAYDHAVYFVADAQVDAFEIGSLLRQLIEVWELNNESEPGSTLLPTLRAALLKAEGGHLEVPQAAVSAELNAANGAKARLEIVSKKQLEKVFGADRFQPLPWYKTGLQRCAAVARIESVTGIRSGTGFLVKATDFFLGRNDSELLLLTNAHVITPTDDPFPGALPPEAAVAVFEATNQTFLVGELVWSSDPDHLDATFVKLESLSEDAETCPLKPPAAEFDSTKQQRIYVIGYPEGGGLSFSLQDSVWLDTDGKVLHYRTPTNPGSSGSPVFDEEFWTLIALHHAGEKDMPRLKGQAGSYEANEGISISAIQQATKVAASGGASKSN
jgi:V8-like Glu-specific endopeptidase